MADADRIIVLQVHAADARGRRRGRVLFLYDLAQPFTVSGSEGVVPAVPTPYATLGGVAPEVAQFQLLTSGQVDALDAGTMVAEVVNGTWPVTESDLQVTARLMAHYPVRKAATMAELATRYEYMGVAFPAPPGV